MRIEYTLAGVSPLIMHNLAAGLDTRSPVSRQIAALAAKKGGNRTDVDDLRLQELGCQQSLYLGADGKPTLPAAALRAMISPADLSRAPEAGSGAPAATAELVKPPATTSLERRRRYQPSVARPRNPLSAPACIELSRRRASTPSSKLRVSRSSRVRP